MGEAATWEEDEILTELIDGKIVMMSPRPLVNHMEVAGAIYAIFRVALRGKKCRAFPDGVDLYLDEKNHFIPDAMIVCDPSQVKPNHIEGAPTLVVEVLSPSTEKYDRGKKLRAYAAAGVQEYWIVDALGRHIEVYRLQEGRLDIHRVYQYYSPEDIQENQKRSEAYRLSDEDMEQTITVDLCGGFTVSLGDVFENVLP